ncbi:hypothetical protein [Mycetocola sp.]|uniref:hypothetical protein n=1 Tax=Mycetocola sp. TaxID=1871042 RepID=UPI0039894434
MLVEGSIRWQITEDCPRDLLLALALRELGGLSEVCEEQIPPADPALDAVQLGGIDTDALAAQWRGWWAGIVRRATRPFISQVRPPHFEVFDRALELQELVYNCYDRATTWVEDRHAEYLRAVGAREHPLADAYELVQRRQFELRRQSGSFRLDLEVLPVRGAGAWVVAPDTVIISQALRDDPVAFREWLKPVVVALV